MNFIKHLSVIYNTFLEHANSTHKHVIMALIKKLADLETDTGLMLLELCVITATGKWLDEWGSWFGLQRRRNEMDKEYSERIILSIKSPKSTIQALKEHSANFLNYEYQDKYTIDDITIIEPWTNIAVYSQRGTLSGLHRFPDSEYWRRNVIDISIPEDVTKDFIDMINKIKAAGIHVIYSVSPLSRSGLIIGYNKNANNLIDFSVSFENKIHRMSEGVMLSIKASQFGALSGRKTLWGIEARNIFDFDIANMFRDWENSYVFRNKNFYTYEVIRPNKEPALILSKQQGLLSGYLKQHEQIIKHEKDLTKIDKIHLQAEVQRDLLFIASHILSSQSRLSENTVLSGAYGENYIYSPLKANANIFIDSKEFKIRIDKTLLFDLLGPFEATNKKLLSGSRKIHHENNYFTELPINKMHRKFTSSVIFAKNKKLENPIVKYGLKTIGWDWHSKIYSIDDTIDKFKLINIFDLCDSSTENIKIPDELSVQKGLISGEITDKKYLVYDTRDLTILEQAFVQSEIKRELLFLKPSVYSVQSRLSSDVTLSGAFDEKYDYKERIKNADLFIGSSLIDIKPDIKLIIENFVKTGIEKSVLSGNRNTVTDSTIFINTLIFNSLWVCSQVLLVDDLIKINKGRTLNQISDKNMLLMQPTATNLSQNIFTELNIKIKSGEIFGDRLLSIDYLVARDEDKNIEYSTVSIQMFASNSLWIFSQVITVDDLIKTTQNNSIDDISDRNILLTSPSAISLK